MAGGRPTDYLPEYCEGVIAAGERGKTLTWFAAKIGQAVRTLYHWKDAHPEFSHACDRARAAFQAHWEDRLDAAVGDRNQNSSVIMTFMAATCSDFRPNQVVEHKVSGQVAVRSLPRQELERLAAGAILDAEIVGESPAQLTSPANPTQDNPPENPPK
jgi:hypothetical protein